MFSERDLPLWIELSDGVKLKIRNNCDYRIVLDCIDALNDEELTDESKTKCAFVIFFENYKNITNAQEAINDIAKIISYNDEPANVENENKPILMDWKKDFHLIAAAVSSILGYDVRTPEKYTHWWTFISAFMEIKKSNFSTVISIRSKLSKGIKLEKWEEEFYREHRDWIILPVKYTQEEKELLKMFEQDVL